MWTVIFAKAFAMVAAADPALRQSFACFPWPHLYEHVETIAAITMEREHRGEQVVFVNRIRHAHERPLMELDAELRHSKEGPAESVPALKRTLRLSRLPRPVRRLALWLALCASGRMRERHSGTFGVTSVAAEGAGAFRIVSPLTATVHYGLFDDKDRLDLRLSFDHRVFDGVVAARALVALEQVLHGAILDELRQLAVPAKAA
jgi:hypothetical protein